MIRMESQDVTMASIFNYLYVSNYVSVMRLQRPLLSGYPAQALAHKEIALAYYRPI